MRLRTLLAALALVACGTTTTPQPDPFPPGSFDDPDDDPAQGPGNQGSPSNNTADAGTADAGTPDRACATGKDEDQNGLDDGCEVPIPL
jgi:hypothetical protein